MERIWDFAEFYHTAFKSFEDAEVIKQPIAIRYLVSCNFEKISPDLCSKYSNKHTGEAGALPNRRKREIFISEISELERRIQLALPDSSDEGDKETILKECADFIITAFREKQYKTELKLDELESIYAKGTMEACLKLIALAFKESCRMDTAKTEAPDTETKNAEKSTESNHESEDALRKQLQLTLEKIIEKHPSFALMAKDGIDERLFPGAKGFQQSPALEKTENGGPVSPVWNIIRKSWNQCKSPIIVIEGSGGIGKTVTLFSLLNIPEKERPPAVYVPMHRLVDEKGQCISLKDYLGELTTNYKDELLKLAEDFTEHGPSLLLLLDGFNEVQDNGQRGEILRMINKWYEHNHGTQLIVASRPMEGMNLKEVLQGEKICITLEPLSRETVKNYLDRDTPPDDSSVWNVLTSPLFLNLYSKECNLKNFTYDGYPLALKPAQTGSALIWNYLQRELLRKEGDEWVIPCAVACEWILPYIAYDMVCKNRITVKKDLATSLINQALKLLSLQEVLLPNNNKRLPRHLQKMIRIYLEQHEDDDPVLSPEHINAIVQEKHIKKIVLENSGLLKKNENGYTFLHQNFRDALAAIHLMNQAEMLQEGDVQPDGKHLPEVWRHGQNPYVLNYAAELMDGGNRDNDEDPAGKLWEANREDQQYHDPNYEADPEATYALLELFRHRKLPEPTGSWDLDFSGMDLQGMSLTRYMRNTDKNETDLMLFQDPELSVDTKLDEAVFQSPGHTGAVKAVSVTDDGLCVSGSVDKTLRVWNIKTGYHLRTLQGHDSPIDCVTTLGIKQEEDTKKHRTLCVSGDRNGTLCVWDINSYKLLYKKERAHDGVINCVTLLQAPVNQNLGETQILCISGSDDCSIKVWDITDVLEYAVEPRLLRRWKAHDKAVNCVAVISNAEFAKAKGKKTICISGSEDGTIKVWDLLASLETEDPKPLLSRSTAPKESAPKGPVNCVAAINETETNKPLCVFGLSDGTLGLWDIAKGQDAIQVLGKSTGTVYSVSLSVNKSNNHLICVSGEAQALRVWDLCDHSQGQINVSNGPVYCTALTADGQCVSGSLDNKVQVWDIQTRSSIHTFKPVIQTIERIAASDEVFVCGIAFSGSNAELLRSNYLQVWSMRDRTCLQTVLFENNNVDGLVMTGKRSWVSFITDRSVPAAWEYNQDGLKRTNFIFEKEEGCLTSIAVMDHTCVSYSCGHTPPLQVWDIQNKVCIKEISVRKEAGRIDCLALVRTEDKKLLCVGGSSNGTLWMWDISPESTGQGWKLPEKHSGRVFDIAAIGSQVISADSNGIIRIWEVLDGGDVKCLRVLDGEAKHNGHVNCLSVLTGANGERFFISGSGDNTLRVWDLADLSSYRSLEGHTAQINCVAAFYNQAENQNQCVSGSDDGTMRLWNMETGECINAFYPTEVNVSRMCFNMEQGSPLAELLQRNRATIKPKQ